MSAPTRGTYRSARGLGGTSTAAQAYQRGLYLGMWPFLWPPRWGAGSSGGYAYLSAGRMAAGAGYRFASTGTGGGAMGATPISPTPHTVTLRSGEKNVPFSLDFTPDMGSGDSVSSAAITVWAASETYEAGSPATTDVTSILLRSQSIAGGAVVTAVLGNANATKGTQYTVRVVATLASGLVLQETIDGIICDS